MSNKQIGLLMQKNILESFQDFMIKTAKKCKIDIEGLDLPVHFTNPPVFGTQTTTFTEFLAPGSVIAIIFFFSTCSSSMSMVMEKCSGALERNTVAGVTNLEIMISHLCTQMLLLFIQVSAIYGIVFVIFQIHILGSAFLAFMISMLVGTGGISFGFVISALSRNELESVLLTIIVFMPNLMLSGVIWPLEGLSPILYFISLFLPATLSCQSLRAIISKGSPFFNPKVWPGFFSTFVMIISYWIIAIWINKIKTKH